MPLTAKLVKRVNGSIYIQLAATLIIALCLGAFIWLTAIGVNAYWPEPAAAIYAGLFLLSMVLLILRRRYDALMLLAAAVCLCCAFYARVTLLGFQSSDFVSCLLPWTKKLGALPLKEALSTPIGDYNLPYLYFLTALSRTGWDELLHIKSMSCFFDVVLAYTVLRLVALEVKDRRLELASFLIVLISPTVMIDSAQWAQCDSVYVAFCLISVLGAMTGRGRLCAIGWTLAFCFKLQAVFILPALAVALFMGRVKPKHLLWIPGVYFLSLLPALLCGRSLLSCMNIYGGQMGEYAKLWYNAPTVWRFFGATRPEEYQTTAIYIGVGAVVIFTVLALTLSKKMTSRQLLKLFFISALLVPFLLPRMHERYFYMAEILALVYFMYDRRKWYAPVTLTFASLCSYTGALVGDSAVNGLYFSIAYLIILATETRALFKELWSITPDCIELE